LANKAGLLGASLMMSITIVLAAVVGLTSSYNLTTAVETGGGLFCLFLTALLLWLYQKKPASGENFRKRC
jgi:hypothetical protein